MIDGILRPIIQNKVQNPSKDLSKNIITQQIKIKKISDFKEVT